MTISDEARALIAEEEKILADINISLQNQLQRDAHRLVTERARSRELTSNLVAAKRVEDKAMLASDEAVSHGLSDQKQRDITNIETLLKKPYFARIVLSEEQADGSLKKIEYKLGFAANPDCRIVDWRKAPIAKLYYEYKEGDLYSDMILGRERTGTIELRHSVEIENRVLKRLVCRCGVFEKQNGEWKEVGKPGAERSKKSGALPEILALITAEQFRTITEDATTAIIIQGIAGSGKTTVALHRLAWCLHSENSALKPHEALIVVLSPVLKAYISKTLPAMEVHGVRVLTFSEFACESIKVHLPNFVEAGKLRRAETPCPTSIERVKRSMAMLAAIEKYADGYKNRTTWQGYTQDILAVLSDFRTIISSDETKLLSADLINETRQRTITNFAAGTIDEADEALILRLIELKVGGVSLRAGTVGRYGHIVVDEIQDCSAPQIASLIGAVNKTSNLTLVGDNSQQINANSSFPDWEKLRERWAFKDSMSKFVSLTVSHRSTLPIMKFAEAVQGRATVSSGRPGRTPIWFRCQTEAKGIVSMRDWLLKAIEKYPGQMTAVICHDLGEAKDALSLLKPTFGGAIRLGDSTIFAFDEGIVVSAVKEVKGLEFTNVAIWNPSARRYPDMQENRNALYIAATRAEENLALVTWAKPSPLLPDFKSDLVRGMLVLEEEEQQDDNFEKQRHV